MITEAQNSQDRESHAFFLALERRRTNALVQREMAVIEELHGPNYELITPAGKVLTREEYIAAIAAATFYTGWEVAEMRVRVSEHMAVVRYKALLRFPSSREVRCWHTDTYEKLAGRWLAVWSQATELRQPVTQA